MENQSSVQRKQQKKMYALHIYKKKKKFFLNQQMDPYILETIHNKIYILQDVKQCTGI